MKNFTLTAKIIAPLFLVLLTMNVLAQGDAIHKLKDSVYQLEEVIVTGQYSPQSLKKSVHKVRVINSERIKMRGANDVLGVLNNEAGIRLSTDYTLGETDINIMGVSGQNVKILLDGVPLVDRGSTRQSLSQIDINAVERIEIVEGPMSVVFGTDALAGVINIITKKSKGNENNITVTARIQEETVAGDYRPLSNEGVHNENIGMNWQRGKTFGSLLATRNTFGGWTGNAEQRAQEWKPKDQYLLSGSFGYRNKNIQAWYRLDYMNEDIYVAGALNPNNYRAKDQDFITDRFTHQLQSEWQVNKALTINSAISYQDYQRKTETYTLDYTTGTKTPSPDAGEWDVSSFKTYFFRSTAQWFISDKLSFQPGVEVKSDNTSGQRISGSPTINDYSLFASAEWKPAEWINIRPGLRFSKNSVYDAPPVIPSINTKFALDDKTDLRLSYGRGFRAPILRELYFYYFDVNHSIEGNSNLEAETSNSFQASLSRQMVATGKVKLASSVTAFYNSFHNRISLAAGSNNIFTYINIDRYKTTGATVENNFSYKHLTATLGLSYIARYNLYAADPTFKSESLPDFTWSPEVTSNVTMRFPKLKAQAGIFYKFTGSLPSYQTAYNQATAQTDVYLARIASYHWADLTLSKDIFKYLSVQGGIKNLGNIKRLQNSSADTGAAAHSSGGPVLLAYGRSYFMGLNFQLSKH